MTPEQIRNAKRRGMSDPAIALQHAQDLQYEGMSMEEALSIASQDVQNVEAYPIDPETGGTMSKADQDKYLEEYEAELNEMAEKNEEFAKLRNAALSSNDPGEIAKAIESSEELQKAANKFAEFLSPERPSLGEARIGYDPREDWGALGWEIPSAIDISVPGDARLNEILTGGTAAPTPPTSPYAADPTFDTNRVIERGGSPYAGTFQGEFGSPFLRSEFVGANISPAEQMQRFASFMPVTTVSPDIADYMQRITPELVTSVYAQGAGLPGSPYAVTDDSGMSAFERYLGSGTRLTPDQMRQYANEVNTALLSSEAPTQRQQFLQAAYADPATQRNLYQQALGSGTSAATRDILDRMINRQYRQQQFATPGQAFLPGAGQPRAYEDPRPGLLGQPFDTEDYVNPFEQFMLK